MGILGLADVVFNNAPQIEPSFPGGDDREGRELGPGMCNFNGLDRGQCYLFVVNARHCQLGSKNLDHS